MKKTWKIHFTSHQVAAAIRATLAEYIKDGSAPNAYEVGSGLCEDFAGDVLKRLHGFSGWQIRESEANARSLGSEELAIDGVADLAAWRAYGAVIPKDVRQDELRRVLGHCHVWVYDQATKLHHDAEAPDGVRNPLTLPFFRRKVDFLRSHPGVVARDLGLARGRTETRLAADAVFSLPHSSTVVHLEERLGKVGTIEIWAVKRVIERPRDGFWIAAIDRRNKLVAGTVEVLLYRAEDVKPTCRQDLEELGVDRARVGVVNGAALLPQYRRRGVGAGMYLGALTVARRLGLGLAADACSWEGDTSTDAGRVWASRALRAGGAIVGRSGRVAALAP